MMDHQTMFHEAFYMRDPLFVNQDKLHVFVNTLTLLIMCKSIIRELMNNIHLGVQFKSPLICYISNLKNLFLKLYIGEDKDHQSKNQSQITSRYISVLIVVHYLQD